jgi:alanine racemase
MAAADRLAEAPATATAVALIDLAAVAANFRALAARHAAPIAGVVKADAYGLSAAHVAPVLVREGAAMLFTAGFDEAAALDASVPRAVLDGLTPGAEPAFIAERLLPVLNDLGQVRAWATAARRAGRRLPCLLHLDTGMARLGLDAAETARLIDDPSDLAALDVRYVMTHLACADDPAEPLNRWQLDRFDAATARLPPMPRSIANSSGLFLGAAYRSELARPGAATYGINPTPGRPNPMRPVVTLYARILQVRTIAPGDSVGYGASFVARRPTRVATAAIGYADGFPRAMSSPGGAAHAMAALDGTEFPLVGRVSMDLTTFDVSDLPDGAARPGGWVTLMDAARDADALGARANTIGYEILTGLSRRAHRIWHGH